MAVFLKQREVADRWGISVRTLEGWRYRQDGGPDFVRIGRAVRYPLHAVEHFERENFCTIVHHRTGQRTN